MNLRMLLMSSALVTLSPTAFANNDYDTSVNRPFWQTTILTKGDARLSQPFPGQSEFFAAATPSEGTDSNPGPTRSDAMWKGNIDLNRAPASIFEDEDDGYEWED